jgi:A/G-specific adenine glycosylase
MLQQTRVAQGLPYYLKFESAFPTVFDLAAASEQEVLKLWQGLGYYSRARNLHTTAKTVANNFGGIFPETYKELLSLKGVGDYTASAIASICYDAPQAVVDGNVYRVLSRVFGIATPINSTGGIKEFKALAQTLIDTTQPGTYNQAIMEFGARHCKPQNPDCDSCIFASSCVAFNSKKVAHLPVKLKKQKIKTRYFNYVVPIDAQAKTILNKRDQKGIWQQLYEFPLVESAKPINANTLQEDSAIYKLIANSSTAELNRYNDQPIVHKLSHQHIHASFWILTLDDLGQKGIFAHQIKEYPVPVLLERFIEDFGF